MKPFQWSYTKIRDGENCMRLYYWKHVARNKEPETEELRWGTRVHEALDARASGQPLPAGMESLERLGVAIDKAKRAGLQVVHEKDKGQIAFTRKFTITEWFAKDVYGRVVWDLALVGQNHAIIIDYKTGKKKDDPFQLQLFAAVGFLKYPTVETIETRYVWTNGSPATSKAYAREDAPQMWAEIVPRVQRVETAVLRGQYDPRPSGLCRWCPVKECEHNAKER